MTGVTDHFNVINGAFKVIADNCAGACDIIC